MRIADYISIFLRKLGVSEMRAFGYEVKVQQFEEWISRYPVTNIMITFNPNDCNNEFKTFSVTLDKFELKHTSDIWQKHFTWVAQAEVNTKEADGQ